MKHELTASLSLCNMKISTSYMIILKRVNHDSCGSGETCIFNSVIATSIMIRNIFKFLDISEPGTRNKTQLISDAMKSSSLIQNGLSVFLQVSPNTKHACLFFWLNKHACLHIISFYTAIKAF